MRHLRNRLNDLERKAHPPALHIVICRGGQTKDEAIDEYGRDRIGSVDDLVVVIRKPLVNGGSHAVA